MIGKFTIGDWKKLLTWIRNGTLDGAIFSIGPNSGVNNGEEAGMECHQDGQVFFYGWSNKLSDYIHTYLDGKPLSLNGFSSGGTTVGGDLTDPGQDNFGVTGVIRLKKSSAPVTNASYGFLYVAADGSLHYKGSSGTDTKVASA